MIKAKIQNKLWRIYTKAPLNFSTVTGWRYPGIPRLKGNFLVGRLGQMFKENGVLENIIEAGELASEHPSGICYFWIGTQVALLFTHIEDIHELKIKNDQNLSRDLPLLKKFAGPSIFTDTREIWHEKRRICQHNINPNSLKKMAPAMQQIIDSYIAAIKTTHEQSIDLRKLFFNWIVDMVTINLMGCPHSTNSSFKDIPTQSNVLINKLSPLAAYLAEAVNDVFEFRNVFKWLLPSFIRKFFFRNEVTDFDSLKNDMKSRYFKLFLNPNKENILDKENLLKDLWKLNHANHGSGNELLGDEIFGDGLFLLSAGVATTVATLEFVLKLLVKNPLCAERLQTEILENTKDIQIHFPEINEMPYLEMVIKEAMRLYPPVPLFIPREIAIDTEINGIPLFKGDIPMVSSYITHRDPKLWTQPEKFIPERFSKENENKIPKTAYMPFSIGPRFCAGQAFAMLEMKMILIALYSNFNITIDNNSFEIDLKEGGLTPRIVPIAKFKSL